jgi:growth factor-regulated tyrosine kinase substrate
MHEKLSQAVKLYDNLLTEQFTQNSRRQQSLSQPSYPQYQQPRQPLQRPQQWAQAVPTSPYQGAYTAQPVANPPSAEQNWAQNSMTYRPQANPPSPALSRTQYTQDYVTAQPPLAVNQSAQYSMQQQPAYAPSLPPVTLPMSPRLNHNTYQPNSTQHPTMVNQTPVPAPEPPVPTAPQQQPPSAQQTYQTYHVPNHSLSRSNTINTPSHPQPAQLSYINHPQYQQQQHRVAPAPVPVAMPILPTVPTNAPSAYPLYGPSAAVPSVPASEPKEAMLISFD